MAAQLGVSRKVAAWVQCTLAAPAAAHLPTRPPRIPPWLFAVFFGFLVFSNFMAAVYLFAACRRLREWVGGPPPAPAAPASIGDQATELPPVPRQPTRIPVLVSQPDGLTLVAFLAQTSASI